MKQKRLETNIFFGSWKKVRGPSWANSFKIHYRKNNQKSAGEKNTDTLGFHWEKHGVCLRVPILRFLGVTLVLDFAESQHQLAILTSEFGILKKQLHTWLHREFKPHSCCPWNWRPNSCWFHWTQTGLWLSSVELHPLSPQPCRAKVGQDHKHCLHHFCSL